MADVNYSDCLIVRVRGGEADILCNECAAVIRTVPVGDVEAGMLDTAQTDASFFADFDSVVAGGTSW
jgi:hypothetical protein